MFTEGSRSRETLLTAGCIKGHTQPGVAYGRIVVSAHPTPRGTVTPLPSLLPQRDVREALRELEAEESRLKR
jgi:hypothetical protein